jgi:UDPglucose 6-dehydrogenase
MKIGVIGLGAVGEALYGVMKTFHHHVKGYDSNPSRTKNTLEEVFQTEMIIIALPTPLNGKGRLDASLVTEYLEKLETQNYEGLVAIKSTLPLGYLKTARKYGVRILYSPEFVHQNTAKEEMVDPPYVIASGSEQDFQEYVKAFHWVPAEKFHLLDDRTAEMSKLAMNAFAATKISFVNEIERICKIHGADEEKVMEILRMDRRCGPEYSYPNRGPFKGNCLPKDLSELKNSTPNTPLLDAVEKVNKRTKRYYIDKST